MTRIDPCEALLEQDDLRARHQARERVTAQVVGAQPVAGLLAIQLREAAGRRGLEIEIRRCRVPRAEQRTDGAEQQHEAERDDADHGETVAAQARPRVLPQ